MHLHRRLHHMTPIQESNPRKRHISVRSPSIRRSKQRTSTASTRFRKEASILYPGDSYVAFFQRGSTAQQLHRSQLLHSEVPEEKPHMDTSLRVAL
jgi:hypothetical protein